jgi:hypothetical protein
MIKMTKSITHNRGKVLKFTKKLKKQVIKTLLNMSPEEVAYHFIYVAGDYEKRLINETLEKAPTNYKKNILYYISHPIELEERISDLEKRIIKD